MPASQHPSGHTSGGNTPSPPSLSHKTPTSCKCSTKVIVRSASPSLTLRLLQDGLPHWYLALTVATRVNAAIWASLHSGSRCTVHSTSGHRQAAAVTIQERLRIVCLSPCSGAASLPTKWQSFGGDVSRLARANC